MTTTPITRRFSLPADALADLYRGYLHVVTNPAEGWGLGLIYEAGALEEDEALAAATQSRGVPVYGLLEHELHDLATGLPVELRLPGERYLIVVTDVEQLDELLDDEE